MGNLMQIISELNGGAIHGARQHMRGDRLGKNEFNFEYAESKVLESIHVEMTSMRYM